MYTKTADVIRAIRPYQRRVARMLIDDVTRGDMPGSVADVMERYADRMGVAVAFDTGTGWAGDLREAAIWTLLANGFAKGKVVTLTKDRMLSGWSTDRIALEAAALIEIEFGGNRALSEHGKKVVDQTMIIGAGSRAVYVYTDSRLDRLGDSCTKIGRHHRSGSGEVLQRVLQQYSTGNPGLPVLRAIACTDDDVALETALHRRFKAFSVRESIGAEWFEVPYAEVISAIREYFGSQ
jgi:Meiotically up-regulated gene 113